LSDKITTMTAARKAKALRDYFDGSGKIHLVVDATRDDVQVPAHLKGDPGLCLLLNVRMPQKIDITKTGVESVLSFSGDPFACFIPIDAIWAAYQPQMSLEQGLVWQEDIPPAVQNIMASMMPQPDATTDTTEAGEKTCDSEPVEPAVEGRRKGHLRIV